MVRSHIVDKIKHIFIVLGFQTQLEFKHKKTCLRNIHRLAWGSYAREALVQLPCSPMHKDGTACNDEI